MNRQLQIILSVSRSRIVGIDSCRGDFPAPFEISFSLYFVNLYVPANTFLEISVVSSVSLAAKFCASTLSSPIARAPCILASYVTLIEVSEKFSLNCFAALILTNSDPENCERQQIERHKSADSAATHSQHKNPIQYRRRPAS